MGCRETLRAGLAAGLLLAAAPAQAQQEAAPPTREVALRDGAATQLQTAVEDLDTGRRAQAVPALDEAYRVLEVASQGAGGTGPFAEAEASVAKARRQLQNGRPEDAASRLRDTAAALAASRPPPLSQMPGQQDYRGAILINSEGRMLGELRGTDSAGAVVAMIGDWQDTLGFLDLGGRAAHLPQDRLVFGEPNALGTVMVVLADPAGQDGVIERWGR